MGIEDYPGYLGYTSQGVVAIHADWPAYPLEHGWQVALINLGSFPADTEFKKIDDIDKCVLLVAKMGKEFPDPYDERAFHVAIWHDDLLRAGELGFITGVEGITEREYERRKRDELRESVREAYEREGARIPPGDILSHLGSFIKGEFVPLNLPPLEVYQDDEDGEFFIDRSWLGITPRAPLRLTNSGWSQLESLWAEAFVIPEHARSRIEPLIEHELYDTCLRELGVIIESQIRKLAGSQDYGQRLIDSLIGQLVNSGNYSNASVKTLRAELRTAFKFIRNEFAHNVVDLTRPRARALLGRMCHVLAEVDSISLDPSAKGKRLAPPAPLDDTSEPS